MTYPQMQRYGRLRKMQKAGPVTMYRQVLMQKMNDDEEKAGNKNKDSRGTRTPTEEQKTWAANQVKNFYKRYYFNRHKLTVLTPSYHAENYSPDDNRFDLRPFLYPWPRRQYDTIDRLIKSTPTVE